MAFPDPQVQPPQVRQPKAYLVPNQIRYLVRNNADRGAQIGNRNDLIGRLHEILNAIAPELAEDITNESPVVTLPGLSIVFSEVSATFAPDDVTLLQLIEKVNQEIYEPYHNRETNEIEINKDKDPLQVLAAVPNWLSSAQQSRPVGTGGPGGLPIQADAELFLNSTLGSQIVNKMPPGVRPDQFNVYILDTAPPSDTVIQKWEKYKNLQESANLVDILFGNHTAPTGNNDEIHWDDRFSIYYNTQFDNNLYIPGHHYDMSDHGLFIASLIARHYPTFYEDIRAVTGDTTSEPPLKIHLIQALSRYGVGSFDSFLWGLDRVINLQNKPENANIPSIVNCSWVLAAPCHTAHITDPNNDNSIMTDLENYMMIELDKARRLLPPNAHITEYVSYLRGLNALHQHLADLRSANKAVIFGCAGNDGKRGQTDRPIAHLPAAYAEVIGVTALGNLAGRATASYANIADDPKNAGFAIWGGDNDPLGYNTVDETVYFSASGNSPVGLYFNDAFPDEYGREKVPPVSPKGAENQTGLAQWSGTSFATPLAAAIFAANLAFRWNKVSDIFDTTEFAVRNTTALPTGDNETTIPLVS